MKNEATKIVTGNPAAGFNADGERVLRYFNGALVETAAGWDAHTGGGSVLGPYPTMKGAQDMLDVRGVS